MADLNDIRKTWDVPDWIPHMRVKMQSGVYAICNTVNGKLYVGSAKILYRRKKRNLLALRTGKHHNPNLQAEWAEFGESEFVFSIIEYVSDYSCIRDREQYWMDLLKVVETGYNVCPDAMSSRGLRASDYTKQKMSAAHIGREYKPLTQETKEKISRAHTGKKCSEETLARLLHFSRLPRKLSDEHRSRIAEANRKRGCSDATKAKISAKNTGKKRTPEVREKIRQSNLVRWQKTRELKQS